MVLLLLPLEKEDTETVNLTLSSQPTGIFFNQQNIESVIGAVNIFEKDIDLYLPENCRKNALKFSNQRFQNEIDWYVNDKWDKRTF